MTIDITKYNKTIKGYHLSLDFKKCFDMIETRSIMGSLNYLGFGKEFIEWSHLLFNDFTSKISNNGYFTDYIEITRSCHQGCPTAPLYYLTCGEVLSREILKKTGIHGIKMKDLEKVIAQFADDTQFYLDSKESVEKVIHTLTEIEANIGLVVNFEKSCIQHIAGAPKFTCSKPLVWDLGGGLVILGPQPGYQCFHKI